MQDYRCKLEEDKFYHIYNRGNNGENLFYTNENYNYFLRKYDEYLSGYIDTYAYCLLPNHFHLLVRISENVSPLPENVSPLKDVKHLNKTTDPVSKAFQSLFTCYAKSINIQENRHGSLFEKPFKRVEITSVKYLCNLVFYIHANPQTHGITDDFRMYPWSSYERILKNKPSRLKKEELLQWFDDKDNYLAYHSQKADLALIKELAIDN